MLKKIFLLFFVFISLFGLSYSYVEINSCQTLNTQGEEYRVNESFPTSGTCIVINNQDIILDCQNYTITGDTTGNGIHINSTNVTVKNCNVDSFQINYIFTDDNNYIYDSVGNQANSFDLVFGTGTINNSVENFISNNSGGTSSVIFSSSSNNVLSGLYLLNSVATNDLHFINSLGNSIIFSYLEKVDSTSFDSSSLYNKFYGNYFTDYSIFSTIEDQNYFNYTYSGDNIGNYWADLNCLESSTRGDFQICTNPSYYNITTNVTDYAPISYISGYIRPTPPNGAQIWENTSFTFKINVSGLNYASLELGGNSYSMSETSTDIWEYTFSSFPEGVTEYNFYVKTNKGPLSQRTFTYYPPGSKGNVAPGFGFFSFIFMILIIFSGLFYTNKNKINKKAITTTVTITLVLFLSVSVYFTLVVWNENLIDSIKNKQEKNIDAYNEVEVIGFKNVTGYDYLYVKNDRKIFFLIDELYVNNVLCILDESNVIGESQITPIMIEGCSVNLDAENDIVIYTNFGVFEGYSGYK